MWCEGVAKDCNDAAQLFYSLRKDLSQMSFDLSTKTRAFAPSHFPSAFLKRKPSYVKMLQHFVYAIWEFHSH